MKPAAEDFHRKSFRRGVLFYPNTSVLAELRNTWYMRRRRRQMVPAPMNTPMPDKYLSAEKRGRLYSVYLRPWVLDARWATPGVVPYITDLNVVPTTAVGAPAVKRRRLRGKRPPAAAVQATRSFELAWRWYIDGHIVSRHAVRLIVQFMAVIVGRVAIGIRRMKTCINPSSNVLLAR